jgi:hypothetical protein
MATSLPGLFPFCPMEQNGSELLNPTSLKRKAKKDPELPKFEWKLFEKKILSWVAVRLGPYT